MLISDYLDICDPVLTFDRFMEEIERSFANAYFRLSGYL